MNILIFLSLSRIEQKDLFQRTISQHWSGGQYKPLIALIEKLFLVSIVKFLGPGEKLNKIKSLLNYKATGSSINKASFIFVIEILNQIDEVRPFKGFRLIFLRSINQAISFSQKGCEIFSEKPINKEASIDDSKDFESTLSIILAWLRSQKSVAIAELRNKLLPLDMLPSAFIGEINEQALELTGDFALEEVGSDVEISINALDSVIANLKSLQIDLNINNF